MDSFVQYLGLTVVAALVGALASLAGVVLKDFFFARSLEAWKHRTLLKLTYEKYRDPLALSARELARRLSEMLEKYPTTYLNSDVAASNPEKQIKNSIYDPYYNKYKLTSTIYRIGSFLGWLELFRRDINLRSPDNGKHWNDIDAAMERIKEDFADGGLNKADDWETWRDVLVFREEIRAIGESMIEGGVDSKVIKGYGKYIEEIEDESRSPTRRWFLVLLNFVSDLEPSGRDFRKIRMKRLLVHLVELMLLLDRDLVDELLLDQLDLHRPDVLPVSALRKQ